MALNTIDIFIVRAEGVDRVLGGDRGETAACLIDGIIQLRSNLKILQLDNITHMVNAIYRWSAYKVTILARITQSVNKQIQETSAVELITAQ